MTKSALQRKLPGCHTRTLETSRHLFWEGIEVGCARSKREGYDWSVLERRMLALANRRLMDKNGWQDANTGQTGVPLQVHHLSKRSAGGTHEEGNREPMTAENHERQHR